jgi:hypothetical protein
VGLRDFLRKVAKPPQDRQAAGAPGRRPDHTDNSNPLFCHFHHSSLVRILFWFHDWKIPSPPVNMVVTTQRIAAEGPWKNRKRAQPAP